MPVRKIPKSYRNVTGISANKKATGQAQFESPLERDFISLLEFSPDVCRYEVQPVRIEWPDSDGKPRSYRNTSHPAISIWELREAERRASEERPDIPVDESRIFDAYEKMREIEERAKKVTKKARRNTERRRLGLANARAHVERQEPPQTAPAVTERVGRRDLRPFDDVDDLQDG